VPKNVIIISFAKVCFATKFTKLFFL
jgi:hypothetical protein